MPANVSTNSVLKSFLSECLEGKDVAHLHEQNMELREGLLETVNLDDIEQDFKLNNIKGEVSKITKVLDALLDKFFTGLGLKLTFNDDRGGLHFLSQGEMSNKVRIIVVYTIVGPGSQVLVRVNRA